MQFLIQSFRPFIHFQGRSKIFLLTFYQLLKMYNSEEVYTFEEGKQSQQNPISVQSHKNQRINNSRPKNIINPSQKGNGILGTYSRIVPKKPLHDFERLYAQNMQLREKIRFLEQANTKIKTRVSMIQKQKEQLITQICQMDNNLSLMKQRRPSQHSFQKYQQKSKKVVLDQNRRILHEYKDQIAKLKLQNGRLKKTVKYTQIQQLQIQNKNLHQQMARMKQYMQDVINSTEYDQYQRQIQVLNQQLQGEKSAVKNITTQLKKKDQEMEQVKNKMKVLATRKTQLERKYTRDLNNVKGELHRVKQKQKEFIITQQDKKQNSKTQKIQKPSQCKQCNNLKQNNANQKSKNKQIQAKLKNKQKQVDQLKLKIKQLQQKVVLQKEQKSPQKQKKQTQKNQYQPKKDQALQKNTNKQKVQQKKSPKLPQQQKKQNLPKNQQDQYDQFDQEEQKQNQKQGLNENNIDHSSDKVDLLHVDLESDRKHKNNLGKASEKNKKQTQQDYEKYDQSHGNKGFEQIQKQFNQNQSDQQVLFQKQQNPKQVDKKKSESIKKQKKSVKQRQPKQKEGVSATKAEKILKQTIKYRLISQRYTYQDFKRDITESGSTQFTVQQVINMLQNEPFYLYNDHLKIVLLGLFQKQQLQTDDIVTTKIFLKKMKEYIGDFDLLEEEEEQKIIRQIQKKLVKKKLLNKLIQQANGPQISKKGFVKVLKQAGFNEVQIQQSLAEASLESIDIAHINYENFYQKLTRNS